MAKQTIAKETKETEEATQEEEEEEREPVQLDMEGLGIEPLGHVLTRAAPNLDPRFVSLAASWLRHGDLGERLDLVIRRGLARDEVGALEHLSSVAVAGCLDYPRISYVNHLRGSGSLRRKPRRNGSQVEVEKQETPPEWQFGSASHRSILSLMMLPFGTIPASQLDFFPNDLLPVGSQLVFPTGGEIKSILSSETAELPVTQTWLRRLRDCLGRMDVFSSRDAWQTYNRACSSMLAHLTELLEPVFGDLLDELPDTNGDPYSRYLKMLSLMSWGYAACGLFGQNSGPFEPSCILPEVAVLPYGCGMNAGRLDALKIVSINGQKPTKEQWRAIASIYFLSDPRPTVGQMILAMYRLFGRDIKLEVMDLKCSVGDAVGDDKIIRSEQVVKRPFARHARQLRRYIFFTPVSFYLACFEAGVKASKQLWRGKVPLSVGWLVYLFYNQPPKLHRISLPAKQQEQEFQLRVAFQLYKGLRAAQVNEMDNVLRAYLRNLESWQIPAAFQEKRAEKNTASLAAGTVEASRPSPKQLVLGLAEQYRRFFDKGGFLEIIAWAKDQKPILLLDVERLFASEEWQNGEIPTKNFRLPVGGFISCLNPNHRDSDPSFYLRLLEGKGLCYGCGMRVWLSGEFLHNGRVVSVQRSSGQRLRESKKRPLTEEHYAIMASAQKILIDSLAGSRGEQYLQERGIKLSLAREYGVGFVTDGLIVRLLEQGYSLEQLEQYGFIGSSVNMPQDSHLVQAIVKKFGCSWLGQLQCEKEDASGKMRQGWIYNFLGGMLSFPLSVVGGGRISNFYARRPYCEDKAKKHRKLKTGAAQGGFNIEALWQEGEVIVATEGVFDLLTLVALGVTNIVAIVGLDNPEVLRAIEASGKTVGVAFDNDAPGEEKTEELLSKLREKGVTAYDFTAEFAKQHLDFREGDDFNEWWRRRIAKQKT